MNKLGRLLAGIFLLAALTITGAYADSQVSGSITDNTSLINSQVTTLFGGTATAGGVTVTNSNVSGRITSNTSLINSQVTTLFGGTARAGGVVVQ
jgi:hypothetical protein